MIVVSLRSTGGKCGNDMPTGGVGFEILGATGLNTSIFAQLFSRISCYSNNNFPE
jgi:hypothetical protein